MSLPKIAYFPLALVMALPACADDDAQCSLEEQVARREGASSVDCGVIPADATREVRIAARQCVLDAVTVGSAFHVIAWGHGIDSIVGAAFVGRGGSEAPVLLHYDSGNGDPASIWARTCGTLVPAEPGSHCLDGSARELCLRCESLDTGARVCGGPKTRGP